MAAGAQIDYDALAQKHGAVSPDSGSVDYDALAKKHGAVPSASEKPEQPGFFESLGAGLPGYKKDDAFSAVKDAGSGLYHIFTHPVDSANLMYHGIVDPMQLTNEDAVARMKKAGVANKINGAIEYAESGVPFLGPQLAKAGQQIDEGNLAGGLGTTVGAAIPFIAPGAMEGTAAAASKVASAEVGNAIRSGWKTIGNPFGLASSGQELITQGVSPRTSMTNFKPSLERAAGDLKAFNADSPIKSVQDLNDAIPEIKQKIWKEEVEPALKRQANKPVNMQPVADAVRAQISDEMKTFDEDNAAKLEKLATKLEGAKDVSSANKLLTYVNGQLESYFQKFPTARKANLMNNPETAGWEAARAELREQFLGTMEDAGEGGVRDARLRYGAFNTLQDAVERRVNVVDRAKPMSLGRIVGLAGAAPTGGLSIIAGELSNYLNKPDVLVRRGISKLPDASIRTTPFAPPAAVNPLAATGTESTSAVTSPLTGGPLASPEKLFKGGINTQGATASAGTMSPERSMQSLSSEIDTMKTRLRNAGGASAEEKDLLQKQIEDYQKRLDGMRAGKAGIR